MLSTQLPTILGVIGALSCLVIAVWAWRIAAYARDVAVRSVDFIQSQNKRAVSLKKLAEIEGELTDLRDAYDSMLTSHKKLRARIGMRENRAKKANGVESEAAPDTEAGRAAYKTRLRDAARNAGHRV